MKLLSVIMIIEIVAMFLFNQRKKVSEFKDLNVEKLFSGKSSSTRSFQPLMIDFNQATNQKGVIWELCNKIINTDVPNWSKDNLNVQKYKDYFLKHPKNISKWMSYCKDQLEEWFQEYLDILYHHCFSVLGDETNGLSEENQDIVLSIAERMLEILIYNESWLTSDNQNNVSTKMIETLIKQDIIQENENKEFDLNLGIEVEYMVNMEEIYQYVEEYLNKMPDIINSFISFYSFINLKKEEFLEESFEYEIIQLMLIKLKSHNTIYELVDTINIWFQTYTPETAWKLIGKINKLYNYNLILQGNIVSIFDPTIDYNQLKLYYLKLENQTVTSNINNCIFDKCEFLKVKFNGAVFNNCEFKAACNFYGCDFIDSRLEKVQLHGKFDLCKWIDCKLKRILSEKGSFMGNIWKTTNISNHSIFKNAIFSSNKMIQLNAKYQTFDNCIFKGSFIINSDFKNADLIKPNFSNVEWSNSNIDNSFLDDKLVRPVVKYNSSDETHLISNKYYYKKEIKDKTYQGMHFKKITFKNCSLINCNYIKCTFENCRFMSEFNNCKIKECKFIKLKGNTSKFIDCDFESSDLAGANLSFCSFMNSNIKDSSLEGLLVDSVTFEQCKLTHNYATGWKTNSRKCQFINCNLTDISFIGSVMNVTCVDSTLKDVNTDDCNFKLSPLES